MMRKSKLSRWIVFLGLITVAGGVGLRYAVKPAHYSHYDGQIGFDDSRISSPQEQEALLETPVSGITTPTDALELSKTAAPKLEATATTGKTEKIAELKEKADAGARALAPEPAMAPAAAPVVAAGIAGKPAEGIALESAPSFQSAQGYWANTYLPGDPLLHRLQQQLTPVVVPNLPSQLKPVWQPFDAPQSAAVALYLQADQAFVDATTGTRLLIQVGIKGSLRQRAYRPAMTVAVVLACQDWPTSAPLLQASLMALVQAQQPGDRFALTVARQADSALQPDQFRYGAIQLLMQHLPQTALPVAPADWLPALQQAASLVTAPEDSNSELGSRLLLLLTDAADLPSSPALEHFAQQQAQQGIALSVMRLGQPSASKAELPDWVVAGQGHPPTIAQSNQADAVIAQELSAVSRVVARGLRVRIQLAASVKLVAILGTPRLDQPQINQTQALERKIDQQIASTLGLQQDRGADDPGIQIVIPAFYAGDDHVIVLDVVATQAGPLLEASVRYKDLVMLRNGEVQAQLSLTSTPRVPGPLQHNVSKNALTRQLASALQLASQHLKQHQPELALQVIRRYQQYLTQQQQMVIGLDDPELRQDQQALAQYLQAVQAAYTPAQYQYLSTVLHYASFTKILSNPNTMKEN